MESTRFLFSPEILQYDYYYYYHNYYYYYYPLYCLTFVLLTAGLELFCKLSALSGVIDMFSIVQF